MLPLLESLVTQKFKLGCAVAFLTCLAMVLAWDWFSQRAKTVGPDPDIIVPSTPQLAKADFNSATRGYWGNTTFSKSAERGEMIRSEVIFGFSNIVFAVILTIGFVRPGG